jgi:hypothetical protein
VARPVLSAKCLALATVAAVAFLAGSAVGNAKPKSIVGEWAEQKSDCGTPYAWLVGGKSLSNDVMMCEFKTVERDGEYVRFKGPCNDGSRSVDETVVAREQKGKLTIVFGRQGGNVGPLSFCGKR